VAVMVPPTVKLVDTFAVPVTSSLYDAVVPSPIRNPDGVRLAIVVLTGTCSMIWLDEARVEDPLLVNRSRGFVSVV